MNLTFTPVDRSCAEAVAALHHIGIGTGFLSSLGPAFLERMYWAIISCPAAFGFVCRDGAGRVAGYILCTESTSRLYRQVMLRHGLMLALPVARFFLRPGAVKAIIENLLYPAHLDSLPKAEVLSIVVDERSSGQGIGKHLMQMAMEEFARRGCTHVKVSVGEVRTGAIRFYERCGFELACTRLHHHQPMRIYVATCAAQCEAEPSPSSLKHP